MGRGSARWRVGDGEAPRGDACDALVIVLPPDAAEAWRAVPEVAAQLESAVAAWRGRGHRGAAVIVTPELGEGVGGQMLRAALRALTGQWPAEVARVNAIAGAAPQPEVLAAALLDERAPLAAAMHGQLLELPASEADPDEFPGAIAIVGMGVAVPRASSPEELWQLISGDAPVFDEPGERLSLDTLWSADPAAPDRTYSRVAGFLRDLRPHPKLVEEEASGRFTSPELTARWLRHCVLQATERVRLAPSDRQLFAIGLTPDGSHHLEHSLVASAVRTAHAGHISPAALPLAGEVERYLPYRIARDAAGPLSAGSEVVVIDTACSSSLYTIDLGARALRAGETDVALCGGAFALNAQSLVLFSKLQGLSKSGQVRSLDGGADGVLFSDGAAMLVLKTAERARADGDEILGYVAGFGGSSDGRGKAIYAPNAAGQRIALQRAWAAAQVTPDDVDWLIAHATGTPTGDKTELTALTDNAPAHKPWTVTSNKSLIGHSGWAAGAVSTVHALLALRHQRIPAQRRFSALPRTSDGAMAAKIDVPTAPRAFPRRADRPRRVAVSAMGFGGTNGHLLLSDRPTAAPPSAAASDALVIAAWAAHLPGSPSKDDVRAWARGAAPTWPAGFGDRYPLPSPVEAKLSPSALAAMDRTQLMALALADQLGGAWCQSAELAARTGVFVGHSGPTRAAVAHDLRCYLDELAATSPQLDAAALRRHADGLVRPAKEDSYPGLMPNIIAARVVQRLDLHGPNMTVDAGRDSTLAALVTAARALRDGEIDAALVLGVNATTEHVAAPAGAQLAEAAIGFLLLRKDLAEQQGLPVLAELGLQSRDDAPAAADFAADGRHYRGAEGAVQLLRCLHRGSRTLGPVEDELTPALVIRSAVQAADAAAAAAAVAAADTAVRSTDVRPPRLDEVMARHAIALCPRGGEPVRAPAPLFLEPTLVVTDLDEAAAAALPLSSACAVARSLPELPEASFRHVVVIAAPERRGGSATATLAPKAALCDLAFVAAQRSAGLLRDGGSYVVLLLDAFTDAAAHRAPRPATGLFGGLVRSLEQELAGCTTFALYVDHEALRPALDSLRAEYAHHRFLPLAYLRDGQRLEQLLTPAPLSAPARASSARVPEGAVVLATGGARGLTAHLVEQICDESSPRAIWLVGSGPAPAAARSPLPADRAAALRLLMANHPGENVATLNRRYEAAQQEAERAATMRRFAERVGAGNVHYRQCDLLDASAVRTLVAEILEREARVDVVLHGAGLVRTAVLARKQLADLRAVRDVKALGYAHLRDALGEHQPSLWCSISSVSAFMGRLGEADYCAGNEYLLLAAAEQRARGRDEIAFVSALWVESGMAAATTVGGAFLVRQGDIGQMTDAQGREFFAAELRGRGGHAASGALGTTWIGDADWSTVERKAPGLRAHGRAASPAAPPFLGNAAHVAPGHWLVDVELARHGYLLDHLVDGRPTLPGTFILELAAEAARALVGDLAAPLRVVALRDISLSRFIRAPRDRWPRRLAVVAERVAERSADDGAPHVVSVRITTPAQGPVAELEHARMLVELVEIAPATPNPVASAAPLARRAAAGRPAPDTYQLPGTPVQLAGPFRSMTAPSLTEDGGVARLDFTALDAATFAGFLLPSLSLDCLLRTIVLDGRDAATATIGVMVPTAIDRVELFTAANDLALAARFPTGVQLRHVIHHDGEHECLALTPDGDVLFRAIGIRGSVRAVADLSSGAWTTGATTAAARSPASG